MICLFVYKMASSAIQSQAGFQLCKKGATISTLKYRCTVCGWVYDPELGDPDGGVAPGTPFEAVADDWVCPTCGAGKSEFERIE